MLSALDADDEQADDQQHTQRGHLVGVQGAQHPAILGGQAVRGGGTVTGR